ncbi:sensor histidine kinase [Microbacterium tenebrionis]|uniref:sensor histidine kinase n=1 Tax=Microbacterium tenebrionis TaxID=2830665 RepID=UPI00158B95D5|nr:HAMP domain-containing sensor histidine kinase [Microbacterium ihumii]
MSESDAGSVRRRRRWPAISVRTRIVAAITLVAAVGPLAVGLSVYFVERQVILEQVDARLHDNLDSARFIVGEGDEGAAWSSSSAALAAVVQRMSPDDNTGAMGMTAGVITTVPGIQLDLDLQDAAEFAAHVDRLLSGEQPLIGTYAEDGSTWRYLAAPIIVEGSPDPAEVVFVLVYDLEAELAEINDSAVMFLWASAIALIVIAATGSIVATRLLRPLRQMRQTAERISAQSLNERLPVDGNDDVAELSETMNDMLDRIDAALESQRQLLSDVGHELKTPITIVRGHLEVMDPADAEDATQTRDLAVDELERMGRLVQDLASAAALHGPSPVQLQPVDAAELLTQIVRKAQGIDGANVTLGPVAGRTAMLDPARITQAMLQLAQNAVTHGGGRIALGSAAVADTVELWVRDHGPGVADEAKSQVFERFQRGTEAQVRSGSGLGLHIVQVITRAHHGAVRVEDAPGGGALFILSVPAPPAVLPPQDLAGDVVIPPRPPLPHDNETSSAGGR